MADKPKPQPKEEPRRHDQDNHDLARKNQEMWRGGNKQ